MNQEIKYSKFVNLGLKLFELSLATIYITVTTAKTVGYAIEKNVKVTKIEGPVEIVAFEFVASCFVCTTFLLLLMEFHTQSAEKLKKSPFEILYSIAAAICLFASSVVMLEFLGQFTDYHEQSSSYKLGAGLGIVNSFIYVGNAVLSYKVYKETD